MSSPKKKANGTTAASMNKESTSSSPPAAASSSVKKEKKERKEKNSKSTKQKETSSHASDDDDDDDAASVTLPDLPDLHCTMCNADDRGDFIPHPIFGFVVCPPCGNRIAKVDFTVDKDGLHDWCSVCADGGEMLLCDECGRAICHEDCEEIVGEDYLFQSQSSDNWKCWKCDPTPIADLLKQTKEYLSIPHAIRRLAARAAKQRRLDERRRKGREKQKAFGKEKKTRSTSKTPTKSTSSSATSKASTAVNDSETENEQEEKEEEESVSHKKKGRGRPKKSDQKKRGITKNESIELIDSDEEVEGDEKDTKTKKKAKWTASKRKREDDEDENATDDESSGDDEDEDEEKPSRRKKSKKAKREASPTKDRSKRREIKELLDDSQLKRTTMEAIAAEEERIKRLEARNKVAGDSRDNAMNVDDEEDEMEEEYDIPKSLLTPTSVCINPSHGPKEAAWYIPPEIATHMKPHQVAGVRFIWDVVVESVAHLRSQRPERGLGCLLAHFCGVGKSLQVIAFLYCYLNGQLGRHAMIVAPVNTLQNWVAEFDKWLHKKNKLDVYCLDSCVAQKGKSVHVVRLNCLKDWRKHGGVMIIGYEAFRAIWTAKSKFLTKNQNAEAKDLLLHTPDILIADEGHRVKNPKSTLAVALKQIKTGRRVVLTGTPLQNALREYYTMLDFVRPHYLGTEAEFRNRFATPVENGQCLDSTDSDVRLMKSRIHVLHKKLEPLVHRVDYDMLKPGGPYHAITIASMDTSDGITKAPADPTQVTDVNALPSKHEYIVFVRLSPFQRLLYQRFIQTHRMTLFKAYHALMKIWNHPSCLESTTAVLDADSDVEEVDGDADGKKKKRKNNTQIPHPDVAPGQPWYGNLLDVSSGYESGRVEDSGKLLICMMILASALRLKERVLIFSQSLDMLDLLENVLKSYFSLSKDESYFRLDGSTSASDRFESIGRFNDENSDARVFLISTKAGCLGINLQGASRVIIFDCSWNPANDMQAIYRSYRFGQTRSVMIYRLISHGTMEEKIHRRQLMKNGLSLRVVDKFEVDRLFTREGIESLWQLNEHDPDAEEEHASVALAEVKNAWKATQQANGGVLIDLQSDSDDDEMQGANKKSTPAKTSSKLETTAAAASHVLVLDPAHPITDAVLCQVLSLLGPKRLRSYFTEQFQAHLKQQMLARQLRIAMLNEQKKQLESSKKASSKLATSSPSATAAASSSISVASSSRPSSPPSALSTRRSNGKGKPQHAEEESKIASKPSIKVKSEKKPSIESQMEDVVDIKEEKEEEKPTAVKKEKIESKEEVADSDDNDSVEVVVVKRGRGRPPKAPKPEPKKPEPMSLRTRGTSKSLKEVSDKEEEEEEETEDENDDRDEVQHHVRSKRKLSKVEMKTLEKQAKPPAAASSSKKKAESSKKKKQESDDDSSADPGSESDAAASSSSASDAATSAEDEDEALASEEDEFDDEDVEMEEEEEEEDYDDDGNSDDDDFRHKSKKTGVGRGRGRGRPRKEASLRGKKQGAHYLANIRLNTSKGIGAEMKQYVQAMIKEEEEDDEDQKEESKSNSKVAAASSSSTVAKTLPSPPAAIVQQSWVNSIQQPDALLISMPDLALTADQQKEAEAEFARTLAQEQQPHHHHHLPRQQRVAEMVPASFVNNNVRIATAMNPAQLIYPPPGSQFVPTNTFIMIQNHYLQQIRAQHANFLERVTEDMLRGDYVSQTHLQKHWETYLHSALQQQGFDLRAIQQMAATMPHQIQQQVLHQAPMTFYQPPPPPSVVSAAPAAASSSSAQPIEIDDDDDDLPPLVSV